MYYFVGETGTETRGRVIQARTRSDALGLPVITIPLNRISRDGPLARVHSIRSIRSDAPSDTTRPSTVLNSRSPRFFRRTW